jgi:hypothetical protein
MGKYKKKYTDRERIQNLIKIKDNGCWIWLGAKKGKHPLKQYGNMIVGSRRDGTRKSIAAHRFSYQTYIGEIPKGLWVLHKCDVPSCVNPDHLFLGNRQDNVDDREKKNRNKIEEIRVYGEKHPNSKLNWNDVDEIRKHVKSGLSCYKISQIMGYSRRSIQDVKQNVTWKEENRPICGEKA